ncbi:hypothetical protein JL722_10803 [Aureococcus anophagefferens]|nr:hypothetical protein JL722_10803 [Aureococcus anophagefferens]
MLWQTLAAVAVAVALPDSALESHGCALQINDVFEAASMRVEWPGDASDEAVADAAAAVVDELPLNARPAELEDEIRAAMWRTREDGCGASVAGCVFSDEGAAAAYSDDAVAAVPDGAHAEAQLALAVEAFGDRLRPKASVVVARTDVLWADPTFLLSSLRPSRDGVHARYDLYHYARGATFVRVFATALAFARRKTGTRGALPFEAAVALASDFSTVRWWWLSLPAAAFERTPRPSPSSRRAGRPDAAGALAPRRGRATPAYWGKSCPEGACRNEAWLPHLVLGAGAPVCAAADAGASRLAANRHAFNFGADDDARPSDVETPPPRAADAARRSDL